LEHTRVFNNLDLSACKSMYEPSHMGALHIRKALNDEFNELLQAEIVSTKKYMHKAPEVYKNATQNLSVDTAYNINKHFFPLPLCADLCGAYLDFIYNPVAEMIGFSKRSYIVPCINIYPENGGISYHRDEFYLINIVGAVTVSGMGEFSIAKNRDGKDEHTFVVGPGDLVLMRAPIESLIGISTESRNDKDFRPYHKIKALSERSSIILRNES